MGPCPGPSTALPLPLANCVTFSKLLKSVPGCNSLICEIGIAAGGHNPLW